MAQKKLVSQSESMKGASESGQFIKQLLGGKVNINNSTILKNLISHTENLISKASESKNKVDSESKELDLQQKKFQEIEQNLLDLKSKIDLSSKDDSGYSCNEVMESKESTNTKEHHTVSNEKTNLKDKKKKSKNKNKEKEISKEQSIDRKENDEAGNIQSASTNFLMKTLDELDQSRKAEEELKIKIDDISNKLKNSREELAKLIKEKKISDDKFLIDIDSLNKQINELNSKIKDLECELKSTLDRLSTLENNKSNFAAI